MLYKAFLLLAAAQSVYADCKCTPSDDCWPSHSNWNSLNDTVSGKLIANQPIAKPCFKGADYDAQLCKGITANWTNSWFQERSPVGYTYPLSESCVPTNSSLNSTCALGPSPAYTINATNQNDVAAGIKFSKENNVRLVIKNTGHDIVGRSQGYGSLSIWIRYIRDGIHFHQRYTSSTQCKSNWTGNALTVGGGYVWQDVYAKAAEHGVIAVGGSERSVGVIGGYLQGGGHGLTSHDFGLGADQVLEYKVVLASGETVIANECQHTDLFMALRGGGGGTYGVVVSATIKVYPTQPVLMHTLSVAAVGGNLSDFQNAMGYMISKYPLISDEGFSGNGILLKSQYQHSFSKLLNANTTDSDIESGKQTMNREIIDHLTSLNGTKVNVLSKFTHLPNWQAYFQGSGSHLNQAGSSAVLPSRFFDKRSLISQQGKLKRLISILFTTPASEIKPKAAGLELCLVGGGKVLEPAPLTSVNPVWRKTYLLMGLVETWQGGNASRQSVLNMATNQKLRAMKDMTPGMGTYVNEADRNDPDYKHDWYGEMYDWLSAVKEKYDPEGVFWCHHCIGSEGWEESTGADSYGPLCKSN